MTFDRYQKRNTALLVYTASVAAYVLFQKFDPLSGGPKFVMFLLLQSISWAALYFIFRYTSGRRKIILLLVPLFVLLLASLTFLIEQF